MYCELIIIGKEYVLSSTSIIIMTIIIIPLPLACSSFPHEDRPLLLLKGYCLVFRNAHFGLASSFCLIRM